MQKVRCESGWRLQFTGDAGVISCILACEASGASANLVRHPNLSGDQAQEWRGLQNRSSKVQLLDRTP